MIHGIIYPFEFHIWICDWIYSLLGYSSVSIAHAQTPICSSSFLSLTRTILTSYGCLISYCIFSVVIHPSQYFISIFFGIFFLIANTWPLKHCCSIAIMYDFPFNLHGIRWSHNTPENFSIVTNSFWFYGSQPLVLYHY